MEVLIVEMLINVQSNAIGTVVKETEKGKVLLIDGVEKEYAASALRRWWKTYTPVVVEQPAVTQQTAVTTQTTSTNNDMLPQVAADMIQFAVNHGALTKTTSSYIGLRYNSKTIAEIHCSKKGKTKLVINSKSLHPDVLALYTSKGVAKVVPASYGWTLDVTIDCDKALQLVSPDCITPLIAYGIDYRK